MTKHGDELMEARRKYLLVYEREEIMADCAVKNEEESVEQTKEVVSSFQSSREMTNRYPSYIVHHHLLIFNLIKRKYLPAEN